MRIQLNAGKDSAIQAQTQLDTNLIEGALDFNLEDNILR